MKSINVLFVCTGNIFRSMSAEYCAKHVARSMDLQNIQFSSAGTSAELQNAHPKTLDMLNAFGIKDINHTQRKLSKEIIKENDIIIAMGEDHKEFIKNKFGIDALLYNEVALGDKSGILDIHEQYPDWFKEPEKAEIHIENTLDHIYSTMPKFIENAQKLKE
ncbi:MAG: hypothetical protein ACOCUR_02200 [Nanoarchaeota archaeon]